MPLMRSLRRSGERGWMDGGWRRGANGTSQPPGRAGGTRLQPVGDWLQMARGKERREERAREREPEASLPLPLSGSPPNTRRASHRHCTRPLAIRPRTHTRQPTHRDTETRDSPFRDSTRARRRASSEPASGTTARTPARCCSVSLGQTTVELCGESLAGFAVERSAIVIVCAGEKGKGGGGRRGESEERRERGRWRLGAKTGRERGGWWLVGRSTSLAGG